MPSSYEITAIEALEELYDTVNPVSLAKETPALTPEYRQWIENAFFFTGEYWARRARLFTARRRAGSIFSRAG
jgi:hypothetical protein